MQLLVSGGGELDMTTGHKLGPEIASYELLEPSEAIPIFVDMTKETLKLSGRRLTKIGKLIEIARLSKSCISSHLFTLPRLCIASPIPTFNSPCPQHQISIAIGNPSEERSLDELTGRDQAGGGPSRGCAPNKAESDSSALLKFQHFPASITFVMGPPEEGLTPLKRLFRCTPGEVSGEVREATWEGIVLQGTGKEARTLELGVASNEAEESTAGCTKGLCQEGQVWSNAG
uniref:16S rRNA (uracil(1498)-N(3))-methyltransferase n=1 Tax=Steinernema glaseri TaxID=37863 RepID=A0A1I7ZN00_9BILA